MAAEVEIKYNPFFPQLVILIDGQQPPEYSRLTQFVDEDIWKWHSKILDVLYSEVREVFFVTFIGLDFDIELMRLECEKNPNCIGFIGKKAIINTPLQKRLVELNKFIKNSSGNKYVRTVLEANFWTSFELQSYLEDILSIDINNLFCMTKIQVLNTWTQEITDKPNSFFFLLIKDIQEIEKIVGKSNLQNPIYVILVGTENKLKEVSSSYMVYECTADNTISTILNCFLGFPLILALKNCFHSLLDGSTQESGLKKIVALDPYVQIIVEENLEVGKSNSVKTVFDPPIADPPKIFFKILDPTIARMESFSVFGVKVGKTKLEAYYYGAKKPFQICELNIIQRNRIKKIILNEDELILGVGERKKIQFDWSPVDADNANKIIWKTSDEKIAAVTADGTVICKACGYCKIMCIAENVSSSCSCEVRPYLESISVDFENMESDKELRLEPMQEYELQVKTYPSNSIDKKYIIKSSDYNVVNVIGNKIIAKKIGIATIEISNISKRKKISFNVKVAKPKMKFLKNLFG